MHSVHSLPPVYSEQTRMFMYYAIFSLIGRLLRCILADSLSDRLCSVYTLGWKIQPAADRRKAISL